MSITVTRRGARPSITLHDAAAQPGRRIVLQAQVGRQWVTLRVVTEQRAHGWTWKLTLLLPPHANLLRLAALHQATVVRPTGAARAR